jgi:hypothetical protein
VWRRAVAGREELGKAEKRCGGDVILRVNVPTVVEENEEKKSSGSRKGVRTEHHSPHRSTSPPSPSLASLVPVELRPFLQIPEADRQSERTVHVGCRAVY